MSPGSTGLEHLCGVKAMVTVWDCRELARTGIWMGEGLWLGHRFPELVAPSLHPTRMEQKVL